MLSIIVIFAEIILLFFIFFFFRKKSGVKKALRNLALALVLGGVLTFVIPWSGGADSTLFSSARQKIAYNAFSGSLPDFAYLNTVNLADTKFPDEMKVFILEVDMDGKFEASPINLRLPSGIRAKQPIDVNVLVRIQWGKAQVDTYPDGAGAYQNYADISIIRPADGALLDLHTVDGGSPPSSKSGSGDRSGSVPYQDVERYILDMLTAS